MRFASMRALILNLAIIPTMIALFESSAYGLELVSLDNFIGNIENKCGLSRDFQAFRSDLNEKYSFDRPNEQPRHTVRIPSDIRPAIGRASAANRKSYTEITVPIKGLYRGLETKNLIITVGHSNGIAMAALIFRSDANLVRSKFNDVVVATKSYFKNDPEGKEMMITVDLERRPEGMALICDQSN